MVTAEELPAKRFLSARCAESSQTRPFSYYFLSVSDIPGKVYVYQEKRATVGAEQNSTGGESGKERGMENGGEDGYWSQGRGHGVPLERNSGKHP